MGRAKGRMPRRLRAERGEGAGQAGEQIGLGMTGGEGQSHAASRFDDARRDFQEPQPQRRKLRLRQIALFGNGVAHGQHQPIGGGVQNERDLIGDSRTAGRAVGCELGLVQLDEIFGLRRGRNTSCRRSIRASNVRDW